MQFYRTAWSTSSITAKLNVRAINCDIVMDKVNPIQFLIFNLSREEYNFSKNSKHADLLHKCKLIVWDEATVSDKCAIALGV